MLENVSNFSIVHLNTGQTDTSVFREQTAWRLILPEPINVVAAVKKVSLKENSGKNRKNRGRR